MLPFPLHLLNKCIQAEEAPLSAAIIKKNDVNKVDAGDLGPRKGCILALIMHYGNIIDSYFALPKHEDL